MYGNVEFLPSGRGESEEANLEAVLYDVLVLGPHNLGQLPQVGDLNIIIVIAIKLEQNISPLSQNVLLP